MKKYSSYKDSGVEWIGEIPCGWKLTKVKYESEIFGRIGYRGYTVDDIVEEGEGVVTISPSNIFNDVFNLNEVTYLSYEKYYQSPEIMIFENDIILVKTGSTIGKTSIIPKGVPKMTLNPQLVVLKNIKQNPKYYYYQTICNYFKESFYIEQTGSSTPTISQEKINNFPLLLPSDSEQQQIVSFLDDKTKKIDSLIKHKEKKIELLKEKRTSLINHVVTKGLDTSVEMKDSEVEWIGELPSHWKTSKLGYYTTKIGSGSTPRGGSEVYVDSGIPFIRSQNVHFDGLRLDNVSFIKNKTHLSMKGSTVKKNDVLLNITGGSIGRCCVVDIEGEMNVNQHVSIIRTTNNLLNYFLNYIISSDVGQSQVRFNLTGGNREGLTILGIRDFVITIPSYLEQQQIVEYLDEQTEEIDTLIQLEQNKIELLKEYRQSLISEVVTGKVRVCEEDFSLNLESQIV